jgi:prepilin-type processing-associated H-X9-DG protein/prepilin-type N-terminal cleavage/methylation domain-containing protein
MREISLRRAVALRGGRSGPSQSGFTLVELLVVTGLIAILIALMLPVLGRAREQAKRITCLSNLRQMAVAAQIYVSQNQGYYPVAQYMAADAAYAWDLTTTWSSGQLSVVPGLLWGSLGITQIQQCPSFDGAANWLIDPYTGYNYNTSYIGHGQGEAIESPAKASAVQHSSQTALFGDGQYGGGADKFMRAPWPNPGDATFSGRWAGTQGYRHLGQTNVAFCDGHAESLRDCFTDNADGAASVSPGTGFLSRDNSLYELR